MSDLFEAAKSVGIADVVSFYANVHLKPSSGRMKCLCPLHSERTPSFIIYTHSNSWYCHGACNRGGSGIDFLCRLYGLTPLQAAQQIAADFGIDVGGASYSPQTQASIKKKEREKRLLGAFDGWLWAAYDILTGCAKRLRYLQEDNPPKWNGDNLVIPFIFELAVDELPKIEHLIDMLYDARDDALRALEFYKNFERDVDRYEKVFQFATEFNGRCLSRIEGGVPAEGDTKTA